MSGGLKTSIFTIDKGRDKGKTFLITEMPAIKADEWANRLACEGARGGLNFSGVDIDTVDISSFKGMFEIGKVALSALGNIDYKTALEMGWDLLNECVRIVPTGGEPRLVAWEDEIKDFQNFTKLKGEVIKLHVGFLKQDET